MGRSSHSLDVIDENSKKWGEYIRSGWWYNLWHKDKSQQPTPGWFLTYNHGDGTCKWFSGFTSVNAKDQALTGFILVDGRNGKASFYTASGVNEQIAESTAASLWQNFKYQANDVDTL